MNKPYRKVAGSLILVGATQFIVGIFVAEALYSGYSTANNYISDLGVGPSALVFNASVFLFGLLAVVGAYFILRAYGRRIMPILFFLSGIGAMGVGAFTEDTGMMHGIAAIMAFLFGSFSAIAAYKIVKSPLNYLSAIMGLVALGALALFDTGNYLGLGKGGMERMIVYPILLWVVAFGGHLTAIEEKKT
jgi:hypothetical membrane protein